jgi:hypothetical protein
MKVLRWLTNVFLKRVALFKLVVCCVPFLISGAYGGVDLSANIKWPESRFFIVD